MRAGTIDIVLSYNNKKVLEKNILNNKKWTLHELDFKHKYLFFRKIQITNEVRCVW